MKLQMQQKKVFAERPKVSLVMPCSVNKGILRLNASEYQRISEKFNSKSAELTFFIPASGSGSRMFEFLHNFFKDSNLEGRNKVERFLNSLNDFALTRLIPAEIQEQLESGAMDLKSFASYIVDDHGLGLGNLPKGLIPFHENSYFVLNPFQEHVLQICERFSDKTTIHYTINKRYEQAIHASIELVKQMSYYNPKVSFSEQNPESDSYAFDKNQNPIKNEDGTFLRRPSGHGALLENLNCISTRYVFIKNIDNIQHLNHDTSAHDFAMLGGLLLELNNSLTLILNSAPENRKPLLEELNQKFELFQNVEDFPKETEELEKWLNRPKRICGMVKNEGQPGGGPFWVNRNGQIDKQIVEKVQISEGSEQLSILLKSTHFNPVMLACDTHDLDNNKIDLNPFADTENCMVVEKQHLGESVLFMERPGLWNGGMADWISVFVEVSSESFSPVKDALNLLDSKHRP